MVNRGGRSKRCSTCRRRRVKCDERKPDCERCQKAGLQCGGYTQHAEFVDETARFRGRDLINPQLSLRADEDTMIHAYLLFQLAPADGGQKSSSILPWLVASASSAPAESANKLAVRALAAALFGKVNRDARVFQNGTLAYGQALNRVRISLNNPESAVELDILASVWCLGIYENVVFTGKTAWLSHYEGISRLVELRGPSRHRSGLDSQLFRHCRFAIIICALLHRGHCYLSEPEWKYGLWSVSEAPGSDSELLWDIFADVPGILHDLDIYLKASPLPLLAAALRRRVQSTTQALHDWLQYRQPATVSWESSHPLLEISYCPPHNPGDPALLALRNAILLCLAPACEALRLPLSQDDQIPRCSPDDPASLTAELSSPRHLKAKAALAAEICHLSVLCLSDGTSSARAFSLIFPLQVASQHLAPGSVEAAQTEEIMRNLIAEVNGFEIGRQRRWAGGHFADDETSASYMQTTGRDFEIEIRIS